MRYLDVCSGISAPTAAWKPLGWQAMAYAEIEAAPRAVLAHHYPDVPLVGDFTQIKGDEYGPVDLLVGGTPCQDFSVAGLRAGLGGERGNLSLEYLRLADRARPRWLVWENVPGVLSIDGGRAFGAILGALGELGYGWAYRVLDAQHFGVPQRRRRVFVVGYLGDWRRAAAVLFERHSLQRHSPPRREKGPGVAALTANGVGTCGADDNQGQAGHLIPFASIGNGEYGQGIGSLRAKGADCGGGSETLIAHSLRGEGFDASEDGTGRGTPLVPVAFQSNESHSSGDNIDISPTLRIGSSGQGQPPAVCFTAKDHGADAGELAPTLRAGGHSGSHANAGVMPAVAFREVASALTSNYGKQPDNSDTGLGPNLAGSTSAVRRLTPRECERLMGFPDDFTLVPYRKGMMADGPRYKMLGNSMAVPVVRWIGERIAMVDDLCAQLERAA